MSDYKSLSTYRTAVTRINENWPDFLIERDKRLAQQRRNGNASEKVAENILEDLFTQVLDWPLQDLNNQLEYADLILTSNGIKRLIVEVKRPGALAWNQRAVDVALAQARRYADAQRVTRIAVSDGEMLYAADIENGSLKDRLFVSLKSDNPPESLWWLSQHGIHRPVVIEEGNPRITIPTAIDSDTFGQLGAEDALLHPRRNLPAQCFAYVGNAARTSTWKLPYLLADGSPDLRRLPGAIQAVLGTYRGTRVATIPENSIPDVLVKLAKTAVSLGRLPFQCGETADAYRMLEEALVQLNRLDEVKAHE